jgi:hypothetical protein
VLQNQIDFWGLIGCRAKKTVFWFKFWLTGYIENSGENILRLFTDFVFFPENITGCALIDLYKKLSNISVKFGE